MLALALAAAAALTGAGAPRLAPLPVVRAPVARALEDAATVRVLALLAAPPDQVLAGLEAPDVRPYRRLERLPALAAVVTRRGLEALAAHPQVLGVQLDRRLRALTAESAVLIGAAAVRDGWDLAGRGVVVAALDTGVDDQHPDLTGAVVARKCFVKGGCPPANADVGDLAPDATGHGTHIAGIVTGGGVRAPLGLAPSAALVMVRVFDASGYGDESDWAAAMEWVADNAARLRIRVLNLSLGTDLSYPDGCSADWPVMAAAADRVAQAGVVMFAAAGNEASTAALNAPACLPAVASVGAVYDAPLGRQPPSGTYPSGCADPDAGPGSIVCSSNTSPGLDLLAPGALIRAAAPDGGVAQKGGTSQAAAHASAVAALLLEVDPLLPPAELVQLLRATGVPTADARVPGRSTPLLDARAAVQAAVATACQRRAEQAECPLEPAACDGGSCRGRCVQGVCALTSPALSPAFPAARAGCSAAAAPAALLAALLSRLARRRRGRSCGRSI